MEPNHGTQRGYSAGCRCPRCKTAWAAYIRDRRHGQGLRKWVDREIAATEALLRQFGAGDGGDVQVKVTLSPLATQILAHVQRETHRRRGDVIDQLLREHGAELVESTAA